LLPRLGCLFIVVPLIELALLIQVGSWIGVWPTIGLVAATGLLGATLVRREGVRTLARVQMELGGGRLPGGALLDAASLLIAGAFLVTPGVLTDVAAFLLLIPPTRSWIQRTVTARMKRAVSEGHFHLHVGGFGVPGTGEPGAGGTSDPDEGSGPRPGPRPGEIVQD
jgi:UPF0716 protein FxsA